MTALLPAETVACRMEGCNKPRREGWRLCDEHADAAEFKCSHGNPMKFCLQCFVEALKDSPPVPYTLPEADLLALTAALDEHPEGWDHPCLCAECRSHA
jgi:hypothetical protein